LAKKKQDEYYSHFALMAENALNVHQKLESILLNFDQQALRSSMDELHLLEVEGDRLKHDLMRRLAKDFITPIEREDIIQLGSALEDVTDTIEDVLIKIYMFGVAKMEPEAILMMEVIGKCCRSLYRAAQEFADFQHSKAIGEIIVEINQLEEQGDIIYIGAVHSLYSKGGDPLHVFVWTELYRRLESCCDACEKAADVMGEIIAKTA
jgi:predicted phosphate transport protein (TIGR00153 family)